MPVGMIIGKKGKKYGLQAPKAGLTLRGKKKSKLKKPLKKLSMFADAADEPEIDANEAIRLQQTSRMKKAKRDAIEALNQDATVFEYDSLYDDIQDKRADSAAKKQAAKAERKSKYISGLLKTAEFREREQNIIYERSLLKDREKNDHMFGDKEKFVTAGFKEKLKADKMWEAELRKKEAAEAHRTAASRGNMFSFRQNLLGLGDKDSSRNLGGMSRSAHEERDHEQDEKAREVKREERLPPSQRRPVSPPQRKRGRSPSRQQSAGADKKESQVAAAAAASRSRSTAAEPESGADKHKISSSSSSGSSSSSSSSEQVGQESDASTVVAKKRKVEDQGRRNDDKAVMSAKERYLARKAAKEAAKKRGA